MSNYVKSVPFHPNGPTVNLSATNDSSNVQFQTAASNGTCNSKTVRLWNSSATVPVFIDFGDANTVTTDITTGMPIPPNTVMITEAPYQYITAINNSNTKKLGSGIIAAAGTVYAPTNVLTLSGGTSTTAATVTVATVKLVSATINAGGTGYGNAQTFTATVAGGTNTVAATVSVTTSAGGVVNAVNSVSAGGSYTVLPTLTGNSATGGSGSGLTLNLVFGVNTFTISQVGSYTVVPSNPVAVTGGGGTGFTLTATWVGIVAAVLYATPGDGGT